MISLENIKKFFPDNISRDSRFAKYMLKEYVQLAVLDHLSTTPASPKMILIGGTNLRLLKGIDRFSEDLDFDCREMAREEFLDVTDSIIRFLNRSGFNAVARDRENPRLKAFRRNIIFPELLYHLGLSGHPEERFLLKVECQDQRIDYPESTAFAQGCGFFFPLRVPPDPVLCSMKLAAMLNRAKGRDFYDSIFLLQQTVPDYDFLQLAAGVGNLSELKKAVANLLKVTNLKTKRRDCEHLLFNRQNSRRIEYFSQFIDSLHH